jgi:hypothetical protein
MPREQLTSPRSVAPGASARSIFGQVEGELPSAVGPATRQGVVL